MISLADPLRLAHFLAWTAGLVVICYGLSRRYPWTLALAFGTTVFSSLRIFQSSLNGVPIDPGTREFNTAALSALTSLFLTMMIVQPLSVRSWTRFFKALAVLNALAICIEVPLRWNSELAYREPWGVLLNASMSGCLNAAIFPLFEPQERKRRYLVLLSVFAAGRSLPIAVLFAGMGALFLVRKRYKTILLALPISLALGFLIKGSGLFAPRGREFIWAYAYDFFRDHVSWAIGSGLGGFYVLGPALSADRLKATIFTWLHSDWLQILFEQGIIGFIAVLAMYVHALWLARKEHRLFAALAAYAAFGMANMPLRYPLSGLLGAFLVRWAMEKRPVDAR